ncbi:MULTISPECIES: response regulator [unclassified Flavobacterium]|uniref:response regulator n=1 Tax=unclassified Flavobacterium TaxID=196869 RepID=UPI0012926A37|nr:MULTISPECIES: response regulator [unclassified Flavobacterium]MQP51326.1 response regulator [Flavobacterium sp. LMO9]MQP61445.1 response regulator [Flavobacterium sp. LMO6]
MNKLFRILLIDDDFSTNYLHKKIISKIISDTPIESVDSGKDGLEKLLDLNEKNKDKNVSILIFLDLNMPVMDGWGFLKKFDEIQNKLNFTVNLYVLSSSINPDDEVKVKKHKFVNGYYSKILSSETILKIKETYC